MSEHARKRARAVLRGRDDGTIILLPDRSFVGWVRHITLVMLAYACLVGICVQTASLASPTLPTTPKAALDEVRETRGLLPLTVPEVRHVLGRLIWPAPSSVQVVLAWSWWRRCHQASASYYHTKRRLRAG